MSMEINGVYNNYKINYEEYLKTKQSLESSEKKDDVKANDSIPVPQDEYISSEKAGVTSGGTYYLGHDENGNQKVFFDNPKKSEEKCSANTDKVDREIKELKEKKQQLEQQIQSAAGDEKKLRELEKKLAQIEGELNQKDNDTYRRLHTFFSK